MTGECKYCRRKVKLPCEDIRDMASSACGGDYTCYVELGEEIHAGAGAKAQLERTKASRMIGDAPSATTYSCRSDAPAMTTQSSADEIEVTPEMIDAGLNELSLYEPGWDRGSDVVREIYSDMEKARRRVAAAKGEYCTCRTHLGCDTPFWLAQRGPYVLVSLLAMMEHHAVRWFILAQLLHALRNQLTEYTEDDRKEDIKVLSALAKECDQVGLPLACKAIGRLKTALSNSLISIDKRQSSLKDIQQRIMDEMESVLFLYVPRERSSYYENSELFGSHIQDVLPETTFDIEEAGKCLATARGTACVFHLMRVMELLLRRLAKLLSIPYAPSWESYINQIKTKIAAKHSTKGVKWKKDEPFFTEILGDLLSVKIAWRNPTMHVRSKHTVEEAEDIFRAVRGFAQRLTERELAKRKDHP